MLTNHTDTPTDRPDRQTDRTDRQTPVAENRAVVKLTLRQNAEPPHTLAIKYWGQVLQENGWTDRADSGVAVQHRARSAGDSRGGRNYGHRARYSVLPWHSCCNKVFQLLILIYYILNATKKITILK